jgi:two-component system, OmpR family, copper resistance phosphate regulon response regulator CusR
MKKILLAEDEAQVVSFITKGLSEEGYEVTVALDGRMAVQLFEQNNFDLVILDIMMPVMNGLDVCREIRIQNKTVPVLFLTALGTAENVVLGLETGADDYLIKPFKFIELVARIKTLLRRSDGGLDVTNAITNENIYHIADLVVNDDTKLVTRDGMEISLTSTEYRLLLYFVKNKNRVLSRMSILEEVWGVNFDMGTNVVDVYVNYLRKKMDSNHDVKLIHTMVGMGYVLRENG